MTKVTYPKEGLAVSQKKYIDKIKGGIMELSRLSFNAPYDFQYKGYMSNLSDEFKAYSDDIDKLFDELVKEDASYGEVSTNISSRFKGMEDVTIAKRDRLIK